MVDFGVRRPVRAFAARYRRWAVLQRQAAGAGPYAALLLLNPVVPAILAALAAPGPATAAAAAATCALKAALDGAAARALRPGGFTAAQLATVPLKDLVIAHAWLHGLLRREVDWRGTRLVVGPGTRIVAPQVEAAAPGRVAAAS